MLTRPVSKLPPGLAPPAIGVGTPPRPAWDVLDWRTAAACRDKPPQWWEIVGDRTISRYNQLAMQICSRCPVQADCYRAAADESLPLPTTGVIMAGVRWPIGRGGRAGREAASLRRCAWELCTNVLAGDARRRYCCAAHRNLATRRRRS